MKCGGVGGVRGVNDKLFLPPVSSFASSQVSGTDVKMWSVVSGGVSIYRN